MFDTLTERFLKTTVSPLTKPGFFAIISRLDIFSACANMAQLVEQLIRNQQVEGSSPSIGSLAQVWALQRGVAQFGSAFGSGPKGRGFESRHFDFSKVRKPLKRKGLRTFCVLDYSQKRRKYWGQLGDMGENWGKL